MLRQVRHACCAATAAAAGRAAVRGRVPLLARCRLGYEAAVHQLRDAHQPLAPHCAVRAASASTSAAALTATAAAAATAATATTATAAAAAALALGRRCLGCPTSAEFGA